MRQWLHAHAWQCGKRTAPDLHAFFQCFQDPMRRKNCVEIKPQNKHNSNKEHCSSQGNTGPLMKWVISVHSCVESYWLHESLPSFCKFLSISPTGLAPAKWDRGNIHYNFKQIYTTTVQCFCKSLPSLPAKNIGKGASSAARGPAS